MEMLASDALKPEAARIPSLLAKLLTLQQNLQSEIITNFLARK